MKLAGNPELAPLPDTDDESCRTNFPNGFRGQGENFRQPVGRARREPKMADYALDPAMEFL